MSRLDRYITGNDGADQDRDPPGEYDPDCDKCHRRSSDHVERPTPDGNNIMITCPVDEYVGEPMPAPDELKAHGADFGAAMQELFVVLPRREREQCDSHADIVRLAARIIGARQ